MSAPEDFWSRRKARVAAEQAAEAHSAEAARVAEDQAALEEKSDAELLEELNLPDPESMQPGDDFSLFMKNAVPERLRRRALRTLWRSNPLLANVDGLVDYGEDFTDAATVVENLSTTYQVGKGMLQHVLELERQKAEEEAVEDADTVAAELVGQDPEEAALLSETDEVPVADEGPDAGQPFEVSALETTAPEQPDDRPSRRRRMKFTYEGERA